MKKLRFFQIDGKIVNVGMIIALILFSYYLYGIFTERTMGTKIAGIVFFLMNIVFYLYLFIFKYFVSWSKKWITIKMGSRKGTGIKREEIAGYEITNDELVIRIKGKQMHTWTISQVDPQSLEKLKTILDNTINGRN